MKSLGRAIAELSKVSALLKLLLLLFMGASSAYAISAQNIWGDAVTFADSRVAFSSPIIAEVDGNTSNGKEVVAASTSGMLAAFSADGILIWQISAPASDCDGDSKIHSSPAVGTIFGDGVPYVVVGYGGSSRNCNGGVMAVRGSDGTIIWNFSTKAFAKKRHFRELLHGVFSSPALADVDGGGKMVIGFGSLDRNVYLLNFDGSVRWYYNAADTVWSSPTFADLNGDGKLEMVIGTDISANSHLKPPTKNGGILYAFRTARGPQKVYRFRDRKAFIWKRAVDQVLQSSPRVGEVIPENPGPEVVINSGCYFPTDTNNKAGKWTKVFSGRTGRVLRTLPVTACSSSAPALADLSGDGALDVVVSVNGASAVGGDGLSHLVAFDARNNVKLWDIAPRFKGRNYPYAGNYSSPIIRDLDRNGTLEVVIAVSTGVGIYDATMGQALTCEQTACSSSSMFLDAKEVLMNTQAIGTIDQNGLTDVVAAGAGSKGGAAIYRWRILP